jgi:two-component sensor histidine kinase
VSSLVGQTLRHAGSLDEARRILGARVRSLAAAHDLPTRESWQGATLSEVAAQALAPFRPGGGRRFEVAGPEVRRLPGVALAFGMALHELATNAVKHEALSNAEGRILPTWNVVDGSTPGPLWLRWEEVGGPPVRVPSRTRFGSRLIERALAQHLEQTAD